MIRRVWILLACAAQPVGAQEPTALALADSLLAAGDLAGADVAYSTFLETQPRSVRAWVGRGTTRSWRGQQDLALNDFRHALSLEPTDAAALTGAGYAHLWAGRRVDGEQIFARLLDADPSSYEAEKGLAFAALWGGDPPLAVKRFEQLSTRYPE